MPSSVVVSVSTAFSRGAVIIAMVALFGITIVGDVQAQTQIGGASEATCRRCEAIEVLVRRFATQLQEQQRELSQAYARVRRIDDEVARLNSEKDRNQRAVSVALRERRGTSDANQLSAIESRLRRLSEETADLDARVADALGRKATRFERITWLNGSISILQTELRSRQRQLDGCNRQCFAAPTELLARIDAAQFSRLAINECTDCRRFVRDGNAVLDRLEREQRAFTRVRQQYLSSEQALVVAEQRRDAALRQIGNAIGELSNFSSRSRQRTLEARLNEARGASTQASRDVASAADERTRDGQDVTSRARALIALIERYESVRRENTVCVAQCRGEPIPPDPRIASPLPGSGGDDGSQTGVAGDVSQLPGTSITDNPLVDPVGVETDDGNIGSTPGSEDRQDEFAQTDGFAQTDDEAFEDRPSLFDPERDAVQRTDRQVSTRRPTEAPTTTGTITPRPEVSVTDGGKGDLFSDDDFVEDELLTNVDDAVPSARLRVERGEITRSTSAGISRPNGGDPLLDDDVTIGAWAIEVGGSGPNLGIVGPDVTTEWEVRVVQGSGDDAFGAPGGAAVAFAVPAGTIVASVVNGASIVGGTRETELDEVRGVLRFGSNVGACAVAAYCRAGVLGGIELSEVTNTLAVQALGQRSIVLDRDLERFSALAGVWATARQPLGLLDTARVALVLDVEAYASLGRADGEATYSDTAGAGFVDSVSETLVGGGAEVDAQIEFDLEGLRVALGGRFSVETAPHIDLQIGAGSLDIDNGVQTEAVVYIEGKIDF